MTSWPSRRSPSAFAYVTRIPRASSKMPTGALSASMRNRRSLIAVAAWARWFWWTRFTKRAITPSASTVEQAPIMTRPSTVDRSPTTAATGPMSSATPMSTEREG